MHRTQELFVMISSIDEDASGFITFSEFLKVIRAARRIPSGRR